MRTLTKTEKPTSQTITCCVMWRYFFLKIQTKKLTNMSKIEDLYHKHFDGLHYEDVTEEMIIKFAENYSYQIVEEKLRWIPVEEKLPEKQGHYLVKAPKSFPKNCIVVVAEFYEDNNTFYSESSDCPIEDATHWRSFL